MKVVYHEDYNQVYTSDPAASPGRIGGIDPVSYTHLYSNMHLIKIRFPISEPYRV